jgi:hypothetical protein
MGGGRRMSEDIFDFGFTAVTLDELEVIQETTAQLESTTAEASEVKARLDNIYKAIQPLLNNLKKDPERDYIYWPERLTKIEAFSDHIDKLYMG